MSKQYLRLLIQLLYDKKSKLENEGHHGPLNLQDTKYVSRIRLDLLRTKAKKLSVLIIERDANNMNGITVEAFRNLSSCDFTPKEMQVLYRGPSYAPPRCLTNSEVTRTEAVLDSIMARLTSRVDANAISEFTSTVKRVVKDSKLDYNGNETSRTVNSIKSRQCVFMESDKSKRLVALDSDHYSSLLQEHTRAYQQVSVPLPSTVQNNFNKELAAIARKYPKVTKDALEGQKCSEPLPSVMRALPKDHKEGMLKARPVVAAVDAPATRLSRYLAGILFPLIREFIPTHISSTEEFLHRIRSVDWSVNRFASLDIVNLFGSIPVQDNTFPGAVTSVTNFIEQHKANTPLNEIHHQDIKRLLELCLTSDNIFSRGDAYKQKTGVQMGNNLSCARAIVFMYDIERQILNQFGTHIKLWLRFIDDIFLVYEGVPSEQLLAACNDIHPNIIFTIEEPVNNSIPFLDVRVTIREGILSHELYSKPSHSGATIPWCSHHSRSLLFNILKNELRRATRNGSGPAEVDRGRRLITQRYAGNGYPSRTIQRAIYEVDHPPRKDLEKKTAREFLCLPYIGEKNAREIRRSVKSVD